MKKIFLGFLVVFMCFTVIGCGVITSDSSSKTNVSNSASAVENTINNDVTDGA